MTLDNKQSLSEWYGLVQRMSSLRSGDNLDQQNLICLTYTLTYMDSQISNMVYSAKSRHKYYSTCSKSLNRNSQSNLFIGLYSLHSITKWPENLRLCLFQKLSSLLNIPRKRKDKLKNYLLTIVFYFLDASCYQQVRLAHHSLSHTFKIHNVLSSLFPALTKVMSHAFEAFFHHHKFNHCLPQH